ncbi:MAG: hypothetical protein NVV63_12700 [Opitutus sp.]|nr:hypothetical protein [Opitutus sp.]
MPDVSITPTALAKHWALCDQPPAPRASHPIPTGVHTARIPPNVAALLKGNSEPGNLQLSSP